MSKKLLLVGAGAMGSAILNGILHGGLYLKEEVYVLEHTEAKCKVIEDQYSVQSSTILPALDDYECIIFAVKPQVLPSLLKNFPKVGTGTVLISIAAGITLNQLVDYFDSDRWFRAMPNTPAAIGAGYTAISAIGGKEVPSVVVQIFNQLGQTIIVSEDNLERLGALSGVGPGFFYVIMDALVDGAVRIGLPRKMALEAVIQTMTGSGLLAQKTGKSPTELRDQVTSPGGTTIAGILAFEKANGRNAIHEAVQSSYARSEELGKNSER